jgi:hypothetical protein
MIVFQQDISQTNVLMAFNNNIVLFRSDSEEITVNATVIIGTQQITLFPQPDGYFYFNFLEYTSKLLNENNFFDAVNPDIDATDDETFTYLGNGYYNAEVQFIVNLADASIDSTTRDLTFIAGVTQLVDYKKDVFTTDMQLPLLPLVKQTNNTYYCKYWEGLPFDVSFLNLNEDIELTNTTNLLDYTFPTKGDITRLFFSDGRLDESINDVLPIAYGDNVIEYKDTFLIVNKVDACDGVYFKWFNQMNGYSYWKFDNYYKSDESIRTIGEIATDFNNLQKTFSQVTQLGKAVTPTLVVNSDILEQRDFDLLNTITKSPKVFMFVGERFARSSANDWVEVRVLNSSQTTRNFKDEPNSINLQVELPDFYTQKL